jgi:DNA-damage-inducible protein J
MSKTAMIRARVEDNLKKDVENILLSLGISPSEAINIFYSQIRLRQGIPFEVKIPNKVTLKTFENTDYLKKRKIFKNKEDLFKALKL